MINTRIPTFLGIVAITIGIVAGGLLVSERQTLQTSGKADITPKNVRVSNITGSSFTVSWTTEETTSGALSWGKSDSRFSLITPSNTHTVHSHTLTDLTPSQTYSFTIISEGKTFDNNKIPWTVKTGASLPPPQNPYNITGTVVDKLGKPIEGALVYATVGGIYPLSTTTSQSGNWVLSLGLARTNDLLNYSKLKPETTLIEISVFDTSNEPTFTKFYLNSASAGVTITLGQNDNTITTPVNFNLIPTAGLSFPDSSTSESGFGQLLNESL